MEVPVTFTLTELWLLNDAVRHDPESEREAPARYPLVSTGLNEAVALAIHSCMESGITDYELRLSYADLLLIDAHVRRGMKTPEGAKGSEILLKTFAARAKISNEFIDLWPVAGDSSDETYEEALARKEQEDAGPDNSTDKDPDQDAVPRARPRSARGPRKAARHDLPPATA